MRGLGDSMGVTVLYGCTTVSEMKKLLNTYDHYQSTQHQGSARAVQSNISVRDYRPSIAAEREISNRIAQSHRI